MGARLRVFLKEEEERTLKEMRQAENLGKRERDRAAAICLSHHGWYVEKIAAYLRIGQSQTMWEGNTSTLKSKKCVKKVSRKKRQR